jgi:hypothetical protein
VRSAKPDSDSVFERLEYWLGEIAQVVAVACTCARCSSPPSPWVTSAALVRQRADRRDQRDCPDDLPGRDLGLYPGWHGDVGQFED